jgi:glucose-6-phosphate 1-epimerase
MTAAIAGSFERDDIVILHRDASTNCTVHLFGATLISWIRKGEEFVFLSSKAKFDNKTAIRGGIPIVFPCFGPWANRPQHGFARNTRWTVEKSPVKDSNGDVVAAFSLTQNEDTLKMWNYNFKLVYSVTLMADSLKTAFIVENTSMSEFSFTCLLHTYFRVPDVAKATVSSLSGLTYTDRTQDGAVAKEDRDILPIDRFIDSTYADTPSQHIISNVTGNKKMRVDKFNLPDTVIWNPWKDKAAQMTDLDGYANMLCVEAGHVTRPVQLGQAEKYQAHQILTILDE